MLFSKSENGPLETSLNRVVQLEGQATCPEVILSQSEM